LDFATTAVKPGTAVKGWSPIVSSPPSCPGNPSIYASATLPRRKLRILFSFGTIFNRCCLKPEDFADERRKTRQMPASLAREDLGQSILLTLVCLVRSGKGCKE
jgi:hypothetical protein